MGRWLILGLLVSACQWSKEEESSPEFIALEANHESYAKAALLIKAVHQANWSIVYGFDDSCAADSPIKKHVSELIVGVGKSLDLWLEPLRDLHKEGTITRQIVAGFSWEERSVEENEGRKVLAGTKDYTMGLVIYCRSATSFARADFTGGPWIVHLFEYELPNQHNALTTLNRYRRTTVLHELGHVFGLADTYTKTYPTQSVLDSRGGNVSSGGGFSRTVGNQALSAMNTHTIASLSYFDEMHLADDDKEGIKWLYRYYVSKEVTSIDDCPVGYKLEKDPRGCVPKFLFIHTVKQNNIEAVESLLASIKNDKNIINQQDDFGNTALHYAALQKSLHGPVIYYYLLGIDGIDENIKNNEGLTAKSIFDGSEQSFLATIITALNNSNTLEAAAVVNAALIKGHSNIVGNLSAKQINSKGSRAGKTMLHHTINKRWSRATTALLDDSDIDIHLKDNQGYSALHFVAKSGNQDLFNDLLTRGADISATTSDPPHYTVLHLVASSKRSIGIIETLIDKNLFAILTADKKRSALHLAAEWKNIWGLQKLLCGYKNKFGEQQTTAYRNLKDSGGQTAYNLAEETKKNYDDMLVKYLEELKDNSNEHLTDGCNLAGYWAKVARKMIDLLASGTDYCNYNIGKLTKECFQPQ